MLTRDYKFVLASTPALLGIHKPESIAGQSSPELSVQPLRRSRFDEPLLRELIKRLQDRFGTSSPRWNEVALFRSLNMAYHAAQMPAGADAMLHDYGRLIGLWVAAFEILVHPGKGEKSDRDKVFRMLNRVDFVNRSMSHRRYKLHPKRAKRENISCWIYNQIHSCRNDFMHGNKVDEASLKLACSRRPILSYAPILYRLALTAFLNMQFDQPAPVDASGEAFANWHAERWEFYRPQKNLEEAVLLSRTPEDE